MACCTWRDGHHVRLVAHGGLKQGRIALCVLPALECHNRVCGHGIVVCEGTQGVNALCISTVYAKQDNMHLQAESCLCQHYPRHKKGDDDDWQLCLA